MKCFYHSRRKLCIYVPLALFALLAIFLLLGLIGAMLEPTEEDRELARQWARDLEERRIKLERAEARWAVRENLRMHLRRALEDPGDGYECGSCYD